MLSSPFRLKAHLPIDLGKQGVILTAAYINAWVETRSPLPNQYIACDHTLSAEALDAQAFRLRVPSVSRAAPCFLMCHFSILVALLDTLIHRC
jgi:hypothetical protein